MTDTKALEADNVHLQAEFTGWLNSRLGDVRQVEVESDRDEPGRKVQVTVHVGHGDPPSRFTFTVPRDSGRFEFLAAYVRCLEAVV